MALVEGSAELSVSHLPEDGLIDGDLGRSPVGLVLAVAVVDRVTGVVRRLVQDHLLDLGRLEPRVGLQDGSHRYLILEKLQSLKTLRLENEGC